jgi:hypothetical protein
LRRDGTPFKSTILLLFYNIAALPALSKGPDRKLKPTNGRRNKSTESISHRRDHEDFVSSPPTFAPQILTPTIK